MGNKIPTIVLDIEHICDTHVCSILMGIALRDIIFFSK